MPRPAADPLFRSARREALIALVTWGVAVAYTVTYCHRFGYDRDLESLTFVLWFPDWIFWGIVVPWLACIAFSVWFAFGMMRDEELGSNDVGVDGDEPNNSAAHEGASARGPLPGDAHG